MKIALITGGGRGIGFATAKKFVENGYRCIITDINEQRLIDAVEKLGNKNCGYVVWDVSDVQYASTAINKAHEIFGNIDVFVNNAGIVTDEDAKGVNFLEKTEKAFDDTININLKGVFFALQAQTKYMIDNNIKGHIVNVCSEMGFRAANDAYRISKWGVRGMTMGVAKEIAKYGIVLNGVAPGQTATEILRQKEGERVANRSPRGFRAMPEEIADAIYFLSQSPNIIGEILVSDGGSRLY